MIEFANDSAAPVVRQMWKKCFDDSDEFLDIYFKYKYKNENTLIYFYEGKAVASLQMLPYTIRFYKELIPFSYFAGLCTLPEYRKKGFMAQLIYKAHEILVERKIPLAILIPAEDWLYGFYEKYGYEQVFEQDDEEIPLKDILDKYPNIDEAYNEFDSLFRYRDFCIQKTKDDFKAIVEDFRLDNYPPKTNLSGMARIIDIWTLLDLYAKQNLSHAYRLKITGHISGKDVIYAVDRGMIELIMGSDPEYDFEVDIRQLCRLLFGYKVSDLNISCKAYFDEHSPVMNFMLE